MMESELSTLLSTVAPRCFWGRAPLSPLPSRPFVVLLLVSGVRGYTMKREDGLVESRVQLDSYADTYIDAQAFASAVVAAVSGYRGGTIQGVFVDGPRDLPSANPNDPNDLYRKSIDLMIWHRENPET